MSNVFNIVVVDTYEATEGKKKIEKKSYTTVGVAFHNEESNSFSCEVKPNIALTGQFVLFKQEKKK